MFRDIVRYGWVSIHAPAWGATWREKVIYIRPLFQSTRPHGARLASIVKSVPFTCFNPRARMGRDVAEVDVVRVADVSIHAPAWGATLIKVSPSVLIPRRFNPRARMGRDGSITRIFLQFGDVSIHAPAWGATCRPPRRPSLFRVSIHAPAWGATTSRGSCRHASVVSIHAPAWGATCSTRLSMPNRLFQSTRPHGARPW